MSELEMYSPMMWVEDGLLKRVVTRVAAVSRRMSRRGNWSATKSLVAVTFSFAMAAVTLSISPICIAELELRSSNKTADPGLAHPDVVPAGYWDRLGAAMAATTRLRGQDISKDPPVMA